MGRFSQNASHAFARPKSRGHRSAHLANVVEYGLLSMLIIIVVSIGATLAGNKLNGVFGTVAMAMEQPGRSQNVLPSRPTSFGQTTNRKGAPVERDVSGKLSALSPF
ncbi:MAG TPA: hypothetical protein VNR65_13275 [Geobacterales bacterium]|jgi:Flp pilus assembly pilin Flp|nr:hypothetical protein [Geobacterales bacterium]